MYCRIYAQSIPGIIIIVKLNEDIYIYMCTIELNFFSFVVAAIWH